MPLASSMELITALSEGRFDDLLGTPEGEWLDFKSAPYQLDTPRGKFELAKDVAAFANVQEGFIVVGVATARHENEVVESATSVSEIPKNLVNATQYRDVISTWVYPQVRSISFSWFPSNPSANRGIFVIQIGHQNQRDRYFIVRRMFTEGGDEIAGVGVPVREGDRVAWLAPEEIHRVIRDGLLAGRHGPSSRAAQPPPSERVDSRVELMENIQEWGDQAALFLVALPQGEDSQIEDFYSRDGMWGLLSDPPSLRSSGFNLRTWREAEVVGESLLARRAEDVSLLLDIDGLFVAGAGAHRDFLGWSINDRSQDPWTWINSIVLVEFTLEFFRFVHQHLKPRLPEVDWRYHVRCNRFRSKQILIAPGQTRGRPMRYFETSEAASDEWGQELGDADSPGKAAWQALARIYALFNLPAESIPYSVDSEVSEEIVAGL